MAGSVCHTKDKPFRAIEEAGFRKKKRKKLIITENPNSPPYPLIHTPKSRTIKMKTEQKMKTKLEEDEDGTGWSSVGVLLLSFSASPSLCSRKISASSTSVLLRPVAFLIFPEFPSIRLRVGGRWEDPNPPDITYEGGILRYVHHIRPEAFTLARLMSFVFELPIRKVPSLLWNHRFDLPYEESLMRLEGNGDVAKMFEVADAVGEKMVDVFMQDTNLVWDDDGDRVLYALPPAVPTMSLGFDTMPIQMDVVRLRDENDVLGITTCGLLELTGNMPYITTDAFPIGAYHDIHYARMSGFRSYSRP